MHLTAIICGYSFTTLLFAACIAASASVTIALNLLLPIVSITLRIFSSLNIAVCQSDEKSSIEYTYWHRVGVIITNAYIHYSRGLVHESTPNKVKLKLIILEYSKIFIKKKSYKKIL